VGGVSLVIQEATAVVPEGRISYADLGIWNEAQVAAYKPIVAQIRAHGAVPGIQLAHAGRKASCEVSWNKGWQIQEGAHSWQTVAPSPIPFHERDIIPHELSREEIREVINAFKEAAHRALEAGYELIEIHGAHGYLIHEFYSPLSNRRTDEYGGSFENRIRFLIEIIDAVKEVWPQELPIFVRISATDWIGAEGWQVDDSVALAKVLKDKGIDLVDCSSGANTRKAEIPVAPNYQVHLADAVKNQAGIASGAVGLITDAEQAEMILEKIKPTSYSWGANCCVTRFSPYRLPWCWVPTRPGHCSMSGLNKDYPISLPIHNKISPIGAPVMSSNFFILYQKK
jgi:NADH:flavin oxidoreductases, Old Yellow Enzyme family